MPDAVFRPVTVVTVTYGDRWKYLSRLLQFLQTQSAVTQVIVVDNASAKSIEKLVVEGGFQNLVKVLTEDRNLGSAAAYAHALRYVNEQRRAQFVYLLDDDNLPDENAIANLARRAVHGGPLDVFCSLRTDRKYLVHALATRQPLRHARNAFCGNDVWNAIGQKLGFKIEVPPQTGPADLVEAEYAPYGGMFFSSELVDAVGYPNAAYFVYADDFEYVCRIRKQGGHVSICGDSMIEDMEKVWFDDNDTRIPGWFSPGSTDFRVFYSVRNRVALERAWLVTRPGVYFSGAIVMMAHLSVKAALHGAPARLVLHRLKLLFRATRDGWSGSLGEVQLAPYPRPQPSI